MVAKRAGPNAKSASHLSRGKREAGTVMRTMSPPEDGKPVAVPTKRPQNWTVEEKWALVTEASTVPELELRAFLRRKGVHEAHFAEWRAAAMAGLQRLGGREREAAGLQQQKIRELKRELKRKDKALAEAAALLVLMRKKKPRASQRPSFEPQIAGGSAAVGLYAGSGRTAAALAGRRRSYRDVTVQAARVRDGSGSRARVTGAGKAGIQINRRGRDQRSVERDPAHRAATVASDGGPGANSRRRRSRSSLAAS